MTQSFSNQDPVAPAATRIVRLASRWVQAASSRIQLAAELALAEAKLAAISLSLMVFLAVLAAAFVLGAWGLTVAGLCNALMHWGMPLSLTFLSLGILHAIGALLAWRMVLHLSRFLEFEATRKQFSSMDKEQTNVDEAKAAG